MKQFAAWGWMIVLTVLVFVGCTPTSDQVQRDQNEAQRQEAVNQVGIPAITNFAEMRLAKDIYELRDNPQATYAYLQSVDGSLRCLGDALGYGQPYGVQYTNPEKQPYSGSAITLPQSEPNGLYIDGNTSATWLQLKGPDGRIAVVYVEPDIVVSPFPLPCKPLDQ